MSDLISRQELIDRFKQLKGSDTLANMFVTDVIKEIKKQPTAYEVDKVVEQLRDNDNICSACLNRKNSIDVCATFCDIGERLKIVKAGGVNE